MRTAERQFSHSAVRIRVGVGVRSFPQQRLDKAFGLAVGAWRVGQGTHVLDLQAPQQPGELL